MPYQYESLRLEFFTQELERAAHLADHLGQRHRGQQPDAERRVRRARIEKGPGGEGAGALAHARPGAAVDERDDALPLLPVEIERFDVGGPVRQRLGLADPDPYLVAQRSVAPDDLVGVRCEGALLVLLVEPGLVVFAEDFQKSIATPSISPSELTSSTRLCAIRKPSPSRRRRCSTRAPHTRCFSARNSTSVSVDATRISPASSDSTITLPTWCTVRASGCRACARGWRACFTRSSSSVRSSWMIELVSTDRKSVV